MREAKTPELLAVHAGEHDEFVAAEPRHLLALAGEIDEALGHAPEQLVARGVAHGVVDLLETVEIDHEDGEGI